LRLLLLDLSEVPLPIRLFCLLRRTTPGAMRHLAVMNPVVVQQFLHGPRLVRVRSKALVEDLGELLYSVLALHLTVTVHEVVEPNRIRRPEDVLDVMTPVRLLGLRAR